MEKSADFQGSSGQIGVYRVKAYLYAFHIHPKNRNPSGVGVVYNGMLGCTKLYTVHILLSDHLWKILT